MRQARTVVLDNEAVQALADPAHRKHRRVLAVIEVVAARNLRSLTINGPMETVSDHNTDWRSTSVIFALA